MADTYIKHIIPKHIKLMTEMQEKQNGEIAIIKDTHKENCRELFLLLLLIHKCIFHIQNVNIDFYNLN